MYLKLGPDLWGWGEHYKECDPYVKGRTCEHWVPAPSHVVPNRCDIYLDDFTHDVVDEKYPHEVIPYEDLVRVNAVNEHNMIVPHIVQEQGWTFRPRRRQCSHRAGWVDSLKMFLCHIHERSFSKRLTQIVLSPGNAEWLNEHAEDRARTVLTEELSKAWSA